MLVKDCMTKHPLMAQPTMPILEAQRYMAESNIRHLPVVGKEKRLLRFGMFRKRRSLTFWIKLKAWKSWTFGRRRRPSPPFQTRSFSLMHGRYIGTHEK